MTCGPSLYIGGGQTHGAGLLPLRWVCAPAAVLACVPAPMTCGPSLHRRRGRLTAAGHASLAVGMIPLRVGMLPCGGGRACLRLLPMILAGAVSAAGRLTHGAGGAPLAVGMLPCGAVLACAPAPDDLRAVSIGGGADDSRRRACVPCGRCSR